MLDDAFVLQCMGFRARSQRNLVDVRHPKPEKAEGVVRTSASPCRARMARRAESTAPTAVAFAVIAAAAATGELASEAFRV